MGKGSTMRISVRCSLTMAALCILCSAAPALAQGYICAEGGGNANKGDWSNEVFGWMVEKGHKGLVVIIGAVPIEKDERVELFKKLGATSVFSLVITKENADTQETYDNISLANVVFIRGGSQSRYVEFWKGTRTEKAIHAVFDKGGVIGGTSAGCAVLGEITYDAIHGSLAPRDIIKDARHPDLTLTTGFLGLVPGVLFDTHFTERGRLPRLAVMLAHCRDDLHADIIGIGLDPRTALCISPDGMAEVKGEGTASFLEFTPGTRTVIEAGQPPAVTSVFYSCVPAGAKYDLKSRTFRGANGSCIPTLTFPASIDTVYDGASDEGKVSDRYVPSATPAADDETTPRAGPTPKWRVVPNAFKSENRGCPSICSNTWSKPQPMLQDARQMVAAGGAPIVLLDPGNKARVSTAGVVTILPGDTFASSAVVIDPQSVRWRFILPESFHHAMLHLLPPGWAINVDTGEVVRPIPVPAEPAMGLPPP